MKRVQVTVTDRQYETIRRLSAANKQSMSSVIGELIDVVEPVLSRVARLHEMADAAKAESLEGLRETAQRVEAQVTPLVLEALEIMGLDQGEKMQALGELPEERTRRSRPASTRARTRRRRETPD